MHRAHGAVTIGSETSGWIRNLVASNITCDGTQMGVRIKSRRGRGGGVENVRFDNWAMEDVGQAINVTNYYLMEGEVRRDGAGTGFEPDARVPRHRHQPYDHPPRAGGHQYRRAARDADFRSADLERGRLRQDGHEGVTTPPRMELHNVQINAESGPAFLVRDSSELELDDVATRRPLARTLRWCGSTARPGAIVRASRAFPGTGTFLSAGPGELKSIVLEGNVLGSARKPAVETKADYWKSAAPPTEAEPVAGPAK